MKIPGSLLLVALAMLATLAAAEAQTSPAPTPDLWALAQSQRDVHRFSTLFTSTQVLDNLTTTAGLAAAIDWCKKTAVTKVYIEEFRGNYQARREALVKARDAFRAAGIEAAGCVTTVQVGKGSNNWKEVGCYTDTATQERLRQIFEYSAGLFDEIMIDDFWCTDCTCPQCEAARQAKTVTVGGKSYPVSGDSWEDYRCELLVQLSRHYILEAAKRVNPNVKIIIKYPQWYDRFHERGYEVGRESADFDRTWVGTELRDYADKQWGGTPQYEGYFIMRWLGAIGGAKCGGGWYDPYGTTPATYLEQARQTILGGARESMLFCYGSLLTQTGPKNVEALRKNIPELLEVAGEVKKRKAIGIAAYKPIGSHPEKEARVFDFIGMLGVPLAPCAEFPAAAPAAFFSVHALKDPDFSMKLGQFIASGKPVLLTDGLARQLEGNVGGTLNLKAPNVHVIPLGGDPKSLLTMSQSAADKLREPLLEALKVTLKAPAKVGFYPFADGSWVVENFNDAPVRIELNGNPETIAARGWLCRWK